MHIQMLRLKMFYFPNQIWRIGYVPYYIDLNKHKVWQ